MSTLNSSIIVIYYSRSGNTRRMAELIVEGAKWEGAEVSMAEVTEIDVDELLNYDAIIVGSPVYYGHMAAEVKHLFDYSIRHHGKLDGKVGGAFASSANLAGGNETTVRAISEALAVHGMIIQGDPQGSHYGPVSIGEPDERAERECQRYGTRIASLVRRLKPENSR